MSEENLMARLDFVEQEFNAALKQKDDLIQGLRNDIDLFITYLNEKELINNYEEWLDEDI